MLGLHGYVFKSFSFQIVAFSNRSTLDLAFKCLIFMIVYIVSVWTRDDKVTILLRFQMKTHPCNRGLNFIDRKLCFISGMKSRLKIARYLCHMIQFCFSVLTLDIIFDSFGCFTFFSLLIMVIRLESMESFFGSFQVIFSQFC